MAATGLQLNVSTATYVVGDTTRTFTKINNVSLNGGGQLLKYSGSNDRFPTVVANSMNMPTVTLSTGDTAQLMGLAAGTSGTFSFTHKDAKGASGGDIVYTCANAVVGATQTEAPHSQWGTASATFELYSSDGSTNPISFTRA